MTQEEDITSFIEAGNFQRPSNLPRDSGRINHVRPHPTSAESFRDKKESLEFIQLTTQPSLVRWQISLNVTLLDVDLSRAINIYTFAGISNASYIYIYILLLRAGEVASGCHGER